ncbi:ubiquinol-cytochrome C chaperone family protein [Lichenibacterium ramalinae]|uniref:Ubiquinol-cytochrome c chaperone n=1 Tax=Lichenibacterium ramalinae TaxID=2316527 RepID=A0A4Q2RGI2_9HYPH|nr:ubiquinol-cytochrome C chaperone family protein [Lichenibacterium ramalinae]RYB05650.1 ubiquinol-cytochrome c chaperone [Lichenibacterium ramalinae]
MVFPFGRRRPSPGRVLLDRLHADIVGAVRQPEFYLAYGVPDTFEGRFEMLALQAGLVLRRFNAAAPPGPDVAQDLVDTIFAHLDADLREAGVGDITVPKRMKRLCEAFLGRSAAYDAALKQGHAALVDALARNVYGGQAPGSGAVRLAGYVEATDAALDAVPLEGCLAAPLPFPDPRSIPLRTAP